MEYVDECDDCQEQEHCKYDANDNPCGYALRSGVLNDSNLNVLRHFGPANDLCALGQLCVVCFNLAVVCNTVYDPGGNILSSGDECVNLCEERGLAEGAGVTVGQLECAFCGALNLVKNHICRSACKRGEVGCVENGTCRNGNGNIIVGNSCLVVFNGNDNVGCGHCELAIGYGNCIAKGCAVGGLVNLDLCGVAGLAHNGNGDLGACGSIGLISGCITVGVYVVVAIVGSTVELNSANARQEHVQSKIGKCYVTAGGGVGPNVAGLYAVDVELQSCELAVSPFSNALFVRGYEFGANVEAYGDLGFGIVYPEQGDILAKVVNDCVLAEPFPTVLVLKALRNKAYKSLCKCVLICSVVCNGVGLGLNKCAVYIVVYVVNGCLCIALSGNGSCGHCEVNVALVEELTIDLCANVLITGKRLLCNGECNNLACLVPTVCAGDGCDGRRGDQVVVFVVSVGINSDAILVNNGVGGEVRSKEYDGSVFNGNTVACLQAFFAVNVNIGLFVVVGLACEGQNDLNALAEISNCVYAIESKLDGFLAAGSVNAAKLVGEGNELAGSFANESCSHCVGNGYLLCVCYCRNENKILALGLNLGKEYLGQLELQAVCVFVPVLFNSNNVGMFVGCNAYKTVNLNLGYYGRLGLFGSGLFGSGLLGGRALGSGCFGSSGFGSGLFGLFLNQSLYNDILCGHLVNDITGCNVYPTLGAFVLRVIQHLGKVGAYGQECVENNDTVAVLEGYTVDVVCLNGNVKAGGHVSGFCYDHIESHIEHLGDLFFACFNSGYARTNNAHYLIKCLFNNGSCIKGNGLCKYKGGVTSVEVHQAVVSNHVANSCCHQTVSNTDGVALNIAVNSVCVFYLINNSGVEVCEGIGGSSCCLEQVFHIEIVACNCCELINNVVNGVIKIAVNLCGQTVGDLNTGNVFKLFYKYFKGRNGCKCINKILCFEVIREIIAGYSFNVGEENLCVTGSKYLAIYLAEESGINCFENSNDLFEGETFSECDKVIGLCSVYCKNLILKCVHFGVGGVSHLFECLAENACKLGRNSDLGYQLTVGKCYVACLIEQSGKLCCCAADHIGAGSKNEVEVDLLGLFNVAVEIGDREACTEQLAAIINVCKLIESGNEIFEGVDQLCGKQLNVALFVLSSDNNTVDLDLGNGLLHGCHNAERLDHVSLEVELAEQLLSNTGLINNLYKLLNVNLGNECANVDSLDEAFSVNDIGDNTIAKDALGDGHNVKGIHESIEIGYVFEYGLVAANCRNSLLNADSVDSSIVVLEASNNVCRGDNAAVDSSGDLSLDNVGLNEVSIAVYCSQLINVNNLVDDELVERDNAIVQKVLNVNNACINQSCEVGEQRSERSITEQQNLNVKCCGVSSITVEQFIIQIYKNAVCDHSFNVNVCAINIRSNVNAVKCACIVSILYNVLCVFNVHISGKLILNAIKQSREFCCVNVCGNACRETVQVCIYVSIELSVVYILFCQSGVTDNGLDVGQICSIFNLDALKLNSLIEVNNVKEGFGSEIQSQIHQLLGVIVDERIGIDIIDSLFNIALINVGHQNVDVLNVGLQIHIRKQANETVLVYASKQLIGIKAIEKRLCVDIADNGLSKIKNLLFGKDGKELFLGHNASQAAGCGHALDQTLNVAVLDVREERLGINGNGNFGRSYVFNRCFVSVHVQPIVSQHTDRQNCQNSDDS